MQVLDTEKKIAVLRKKMAERNIAAIVIPCSDPHQSEYVADHWQVRQWLTGFTGSAGTAVVTDKKAILWTDFRYWIQAEDQIEGSCFELFKQGENSVPTFDKWLWENFKKKDVIAMDGNVVATGNIKKYQALFKEKEIKLDTDADLILELISELWTDRPPMPASRAWVLPDTYAGKTRVEKIGRIREAMEKTGSDTHLIATLDDIAWTFNLRGDDVNTNPVNLAFAIINLERVILFINPDKVDEDLASLLKKDGIDLQPYDRISGILAGLGDSARILLDPDTVSYNLYQAVNHKTRIIEKTNPSTELKAIKNETEIGHMRNTAVKDGIAMVNFLFWLENTEDEISEVSAAQKIYEFRKEQEDFVNISFDPIMAYLEHSAMCHYGATSQTDMILKKNGMFLSDSGGNYLTGTTDITRTVNLGTPAKQEIRDYTLVLKGHIAVATALFPKGTKGFQIDTLARQFLWQEGMDFGHGTGHGVGFFLCVHEGPARISPHPVDVELKKGMLLTDEPGLYRENSYGIRLENMILVDEAHKSDFGQFMKFENMTLCHFEKNLMDKDLLTNQEINWVNDYHQKVYEKLSPGIGLKVREWLKQKTELL
jgi:Xaa-Pro aminopeptidase